jgi:2,3-dihydroxyphenylpropionate 1,2-dioxygenase
MNSSEAKMVLYEPVVEWICGMAYVDFEVEKPAYSAANRTNGTNGVH